MKRTNDRHHLCWPRKEWNTGYLKALRNHWYFVVETPKKTIHAKIHAAISIVPTPNGYAAKDAYEQVVMLENYRVLHKEDSTEKRLSLLVALFDCCAQPTADAFRKQLEIVENLTRPP